MPNKRNSIAKVGYDVVSFSDTGEPSVDRPEIRDLLRFLAGRPAIGPPLLTVHETAAILRCSVSCLNKWRSLGQGPVFVRVGAAIRYRASDLAAYVADRTRISTSEATSPAKIENPDRREVVGVFRAVNTAPASAATSGDSDAQRSKDCRGLRQRP
jgi:hypothetical protein